MTRRSFSVSCATASALATVAIPRCRRPADANGSEYVLFRALKWNDRQLLEYAASLNWMPSFCRTRSIRPPSQASHWTEVRAMAKDLGLHLETGGGGVFVKSPDNFDGAVENLRYQITRAKAMGSPVVRINISAGRDKPSTGSPGETLAKVMRIFKAVKPQVTDAGMKLALEVHKDFQAWEFRIWSKKPGATSSVSTWTPEIRCLCWSIPLLRWKHWPLTS